MIEIKNVKKSYDNVEVLHGIDIKVEKGTIHGIIGENGSGKTTLIKCMTGIYGTDSGEILIDGKPVYENPEVKQKIGYVADSNQYFGSYRITDMVSLFHEMYPTFSKERFEQLNEIFRVNPAKKISQLSKGQQMRVSFMLNMAIQPEVMVLDEPTSGLDAIAKKELLELLVQEVEERQMTVLISTHHLSELDRICDSVTMIRHGAVQMQDDILELKNKIIKLHAVFPEGMPGIVGELKEVLHYENIGSIYTLIVQEDMEKMKEVLMQHGATLVEEVDISLEEVFIYKNK